MIVTLFGGSKFLCKMMLVPELDSKFMFGQINLILSAVKNDVLNHVAIIYDGNGVNKGFF